LFDTVGPIDARLFDIAVANQELGVYAQNDTAATNFSIPLKLNRVGDAYVQRDLYEKQRTTPIGHWINVPNTPGNFSAMPSGTLTVSTYYNQAYTRVGKTMTYGFYLHLVVGGTPSYLRIALPSGTVPAAYYGTAFIYGATAGVLQVTPGSQFLNLYRDMFGLNWAAGDHVMAGTIAFEFQ
jgi:hypothetical protein